MIEPSIQVSDLHKAYRLYQHPHDRIREVFHPLRKKYHRHFVALQAIDFTVAKGEMLGLIGANGSGKSTLLKLLASVLSPSQGSIRHQGRVAALLELGSGFNPELSGLENVFFYGAIMGLDRAEIEQLLPDILAFADIGDFIHQRVKQYSSGMYVRLAFSVAIQLRPDILLVDEALAVGDLRFQQKCFRHLREMRKAGQTIVFCSHDLRTMRNFCDRVLWLEGGKMRKLGPTKEVIDAYLHTAIFKEELQAAPPGLDQEEDLKLPTGMAARVWHKLNGAVNIKGEKVRIEAIGLRPEFAARIKGLEGGEAFELSLLIRTPQRMEKVAVSFHLADSTGDIILAVNNLIYEQPVDLEAGLNLVVLGFTLPFLSNGPYTLSAGLAKLEDHSLEYLHFVHDWLNIAVQTRGARSLAEGRLTPAEAFFSVSSLGT